MLKITFYVPKEACEAVKEAMFLAGAGRIGNYDRCAYEIEAWGQFRPLEGANPSTGKIGKTEKVFEVRVEMVLEDNILKEVVEALKSAHPYETAAFDVVRCMEV